jgi:hypothetical protein
LLTGKPKHIKAERPGFSLCPEVKTMLKQCDDTYLSRGFNAFDKAQHHDHPREEQAKSEVPLDGANVLDTAGEMQDMPPAM